MNFFLVKSCKPLRLKEKLSRLTVVIVKHATAEGSGLTMISSNLRKRVSKKEEKAKPSSIMFEGEMKKKGLLVPSYIQQNNGQEDTTGAQTMN